MNSKFLHSPLYNDAFKVFDKIACLNQILKFLKKLVFLEILKILRLHIKKYAKIKLFFRFNNAKYCIIYRLSNSLVSI